MVGIVVVSHSRALARAAVALAEEMVHGRQVRIEIAAGLDETTFGTDAVQIMEAVLAADGGEGVVVLMDIGSAMLAAELALDLLDDAVREQVVLCPAPLVEGLVVAAVAAATGGGRDEVAAEAAAALAGKQSHFGPQPPVVAPDGASVDAEHTGAFTVTNAHGLHARPAARLVAQVRGFDAQVDVRNRSTGSAWVPASSLSRVATLGALCGQEVEVRAAGAQAREALDHVLALASRNFDETPAPGRSGPETDPQSPSVASAAASPASASPLPASPGIGIGPAWSMRIAPVEIPDVASKGAAAEWRRLREALAAVRRDVQRVRARTARDAGDADAAIFDAHLLLLDDPDLLDDVRSRVDGGQAAAPAWSATVTRIAGQLAALPDPYLQGRAADIRAVGDQVLRALLGVGSTGPHGTGVLIAADLTPAEAAELDRERVAGVLLAFGSPTSHGAILARARGIPAVVGAGAGVLDVADGTFVALDGTTGEVVVDPSKAVLDAFRRRAAELAHRQEQARSRASALAVTRDGIAIAVGANLGSVEDARVAADCGADLAGLVRTEFLFLDRTSPPDVDEQEAVYRQIAEALDGRRITLRTLDVGGDKPLSYLPSAAEANPFLGVRGIRLALANPALLSDQLLAMVRVAHDVPVSLMFPMVTTVDEVVRARRMLVDAIKLAGSGEPAGLEVGIMVEVPAAALKAAALAPYVDFFSVGTNDLTQYALAAERGNHAVAPIADGFDPGVLRLIDFVCRGAGDQALVAVCGEMAADDQATGLLAGLGVRELSVAPRAVPVIKETVRGIDLRRASSIAAAALDTEDAAAVRALLVDG
jgi:phosphoenolpyruvate-protein phosphotransferase/dihydroxyacetone kinase phosphotransfer subunit